MLIGVIADDFTGAGDIANTLAKGLSQGGLRTVQYLGIPQLSAESSCEAGVISLKTRSIPASEAVEQSLAALRWLQKQGCRQYVFKYCSTFDSTAEGNIGPVAEALAQKLEVRAVIVCPAFPAAGRSVYKGHLFVGDRLLNESGLQNHPLNPMTDPDIRRWLGHQSREPVGLLPLQTVLQGEDHIRRALEASSARGELLVVADAVTENDLVVLGAACANAPLITGGSGIALGLPANLIQRGVVRGTFPTLQPVQGPEAILAGSCSGATLEQIKVHAEAHPVLALDPDAIMEGGIVVEDLVMFIRDNEGCAPLLYSSARPEIVRAAQARYGRQALAAGIENLFARLAVAAVAGGVRRLVVAGGETSGAVVSALSISALQVGPEIAPGVPLLYSLEKPLLALALKSGNFGGADFFAQALASMEGSHERA